MCRNIAVIFSFSLLAACNNGVSGFRSLTYVEPAETRTLVSFRNCSHYDPDLRLLPPVVASIVLGAASTALDNFGTALTNAAAGGKLPASTSSTNFEMPVSKLPKCLVIIRGDFADADDTAEQIDGSWQPDPFASEGAATVAMPRMRDLHHYIELQMLPSADGSALAFAPVHTVIRTSMDGSKKVGSSRDLSVALAFMRPGKTETGGVVALGDRKIGVPQTYLPAYGRFAFEGSWFSTFAASAEKGDKATTIPIPVTVKSTVVESRPSKEFLAFVAAVFGSSIKSSLNSELKTEIDPADIAKNNKTEFDLSSSYSSTYGEALKNIVEYCSISDSSDSKRSERASKSAAARSSQIKANRAAFDADFIQPFGDSDLIIVSMEPVSSTNAPRCASY